MFYPIRRDLPGLGEREALLIPWDETSTAPTKKRTVSSCLVQTVNSAYDEADLPRSEKANAHELRALSTSLARDKGSSIEEFVKAGIWKGESSFKNYYFRDLSGSPISLNRFHLVFYLVNIFQADEEVLEG